MRCEIVRRSSIRIITSYCFNMIYIGLFDLNLFYVDLHVI